MRDRKGEGRGKGRVRKVGSAHACKALPLSNGGRICVYGTVGTDGTLFPNDVSDCSVGNCAAFFFKQHKHRRHVYKLVNASNSLKQSKATVHSFMSVCLFVHKTTRTGFRWIRTKFSGPAYTVWFHQ